MISIAVSPVAYAALVACVDEKPKGKPPANQAVSVDLDETTVARLKKIAELYGGDISKTVLRLAELRDPEGESKLQELMSDMDDLNDPWIWKRIVQYAEKCESDFRAFVKRALANDNTLYQRLDLYPAPDLESVIDQAFATPEGRANWQDRRRKSEGIRNGSIRPKRRNFK
jgi:hypothetical protein